MYMFYTHLENYLSRVKGIQYLGTFITIGVQVKIVGYRITHLALKAGNVYRIQFKLYVHFTTQKAHTYLKTYYSQGFP